MYTNLGSTLRYGQQEDAVNFVEKWIFCDWEEQFR